MMMTDTNVNKSEAEAAGQLDPNEELLDEILSNLKEGRKHLATWRTEAREAYDFFAGNQWDTDDIAILEEQKRPVVTFNRIARTINAVTGLEVQNRQEVRYFPRQSTDLNPQALTDSGISEMLTHAVKWVRDSCDAEDEESEAFQDNLICGIGWTETRMDYETDPEGMIVEDRIDPLEMLVDPTSKKRNFADARWVAHVREMTRKEIEKKWPHLELSPGTFWNDVDGSPHDATDAWQYDNDQSDKLKKQNSFSVIHYQFFEVVTYYKVLSPEGSVLDFPQERYEVMREGLERQGVKAVKMNKKVYKRCFIVGDEFAEEPEELGCDHFTLRGQTGLRDRNKNTWFGLVSLMKDPQRWANKWLSQIQHIVNSGAKNGLLAEEGAITNPSKFEAEFAQNGTINYVAPGALSNGRIMPKPAPQYPAGVDKLLEYAIQSINDVPGVNLELIGMAERDQPYVLEQSRKQAGITILATFFDALRRYRKEQGRVLAYFVREYISDGRLVRVLGETGARYVPLIKDEVSFKYDIIVDDAPTSPNTKERTFNILGQIIPMCMSAGIPIPPEVLDYAPIPADLSQKWKQMILKSQSDPVAAEMKQIDMMLRQLAVHKEQALIQETASKTTYNYARAEQAQATGKDETAQAMQKVGMGQQEEERKNHAFQQDQTRKEIEFMLTQRRKELESQMNMKLKAQQAAQKPQNKTVQ